MKSIKKLIAAMTAVLLVTAGVSTSVGAVEDQTQKVRVIVENNTLSAENGADWTGTLLDEWIDIDQESGAVSVYLKALEKYGYTQVGAEYSYITEINGLSSEDGGSMGCWMVSLDQWFTDEAIDAYTVSSGKLENGDELRFSYSCGWGADLGYDWAGADTGLSGIVLSAGEFEEEFSSDVYDYTIKLPADVNEITVQPEAINKAYRAKVYKNEYTPAQNGTDYKPSQPVPVESGDTIIIGVANSAWMAANYNNAQESIYTLHVNVAEPERDHKVEAVESAIDAIGEVTAQSAAAVSSARIAYDALTDEQKAQVTNYDLLTAAEATLAALAPVDVPAVSQLRDAYGAFETEPVYGNEWEVINLARFGIISSEAADSYAKSLYDNIRESGSKLSQTRSTANSGAVAALTAIGYDASDFGGTDLTAPLLDTEYVNAQGVNGAVYALIALNSHSYGKDDPSAEEAKEALLRSVIDSQQADGGWTIDTWSGTDHGSDADMTAMAIQALAPYYTTDEQAAQSIDKALTFLSENQNEDGLFTSYGSYDCESSAQVLIALCELNININEDQRFIKNGKTVYDGMMSFYVSDDNGFSHLSGGESNALSTRQAYTAAAALYRYENGMTSLYNMSDVELRSYTGNKETSEPVSEPDSDQRSDTTSDTSAKPVSDPTSDNDTEQSSKTDTENGNSEASSNGNSTSPDNGNYVPTGDSPVSAALCLTVLLSSAVTAALLKKRRS